MKEKILFDDDRCLGFYTCCQNMLKFKLWGDGQDNYVHLGERDCSVQRKIKINRRISLCSIN